MDLEILFCVVMALASAITWIGGYIALCVHTDATNRELSTDLYTKEQRQENYRWANIACLLVFIGAVFSITTYIYFDTNYNVYEMSKLASIAGTVLFNMQCGLFVMILGALLLYPGRISDRVGVGIQKLKYSMYFLVHVFKARMFFHSFWIFNGLVTFIWACLLALSKL